MTVSTLLLQASAHAIPLPTSSSKQRYGGTGKVNRTIEVEIVARTTVIVAAGNKAAAVRFVKRSIEEGALGWDDLDVTVKAL